MKMIDAATVHRLCEFGGLVEALRAGHREPEPAVRRIVYSPEGHEESFMALPAWQPGEAIGTKLVTIFPGNLARGKTGVQALYLLFDGTDGAPLAVMDGTALTYRKTAADSALAASHLAPRDARSLLMVGAGGLAPYLIAAHLSVRPSIERVMVWNRTAARAERLAAALSARSASSATIDAEPADLRVGDRAVEVVTGDDALRAAVGRADVISTATMSHEALVLGEDVAVGSHVDCVGAFLPDMREVDTALVQRAEVYVDSYDAAVNEGGDLVQPITAGEFSADDIRGDLYALVAGTAPGRSDEEAITMLANGGGGHLDLMTARHIWRQLLHEESSTP